MDLMYQFLSSLEQLNTLWCTGLVSDDIKKRMPFHLRPKAHMVSHLVEDQLDLWGSPRNFSCYMDEHFVGSMKTVCSMSKHPHTIEKVALEKSRLLSGVEEELLCQPC